MKTFWTIVVIVVLVLIGVWASKKPAADVSDVAVPPATEQPVAPEAPVAPAAEVPAAEAPVR
ncbi:MAG: hypothetical protein WC797_02025 [Candidatus Paceibacterota bacterium]|jgi:hypothetical protein